ncbi:CRISPR-associated endoribonuclease Cas6 [Pseudothermotoga sp.]|nr:CRISPR-associated endoribonuclease Cas6 [Pseudothermotoga sp.]MCX7812496.1 CRISPR-associated endoribonuclease Cas6 [Pseudothermotoga sp.]MDW8140048.1 CRISPR-associated endoribonuclease Cas6 [Pseudothermotoga sp.]
MRIFHSVVIKLQALDEGVYDFYPGQKVHSFFLDLISKSDPKMAKLLHDEKKEKPFTVSSFLGLNVDEPIHINKHSFYFIRITMLNDEIFDSMIASLLEKNALRQEMKIGNIPYRIVEIFFDKEHSKWAAHASAQELFLSPLESNLIKLRFHTPTLFRSGDEHNRYPVPEKVFFSLLRKFNKFSEFKIEQQIEKQFKEISILERKTISKRVIFRDFYLEGFVGDVIFKVPENNQELLKITNVLADFAFFAGVGYKTTMGLGQIERLPIE